MTGSSAVRSTAESSMTNTEASDWHNWCRLCAKENPDNLNVYFKDGDQTWTSVLAVAIGKYFWVNIKMEDELSNVLCRECYRLVEDLIEFSERVSHVQTLYSKLQQAGPAASLKYDELRRDCGLLADDWKHIMAPLVGKREEVEADEYTVDEMAEEAEDAEIMAEIEAAELIEAEENSYEAYVERDEATEDSYVEQEESKENVELEEGKQDMDHAEGQQDMEHADDKQYVEHGGGKQDVEHEAPNEHAQRQLIPKTNEMPADAEYANDELSELHIADNADAGSPHSEFKCMTCSKEYKKPMAYKRHMAEVHGIVPTDMPNLECKRCKSFFATENQLIAHYRTHMPAKEKMDNACTYCSKMFTTNGALKRHIMCIHENLKPFICDCCGKAMKSITALNEHKLVHTDECPFECPVCQRRFKNKARLKIHSDTHTSNNYECNICGLKLNTRRTLNMHRLVHTDAKQYKCDVCDAAFKRGKTLKAHLILHTGIRPYKCNFCGKDFSNGSNCRMHKRKTHPNELAEEEANGVMRSTLLPMITELTEASKRVKIPAKAGTAIVRLKVKEETTESTNANIVDEDMEDETDDGILYEIVEECP